MINGKENKRQLMIFGIFAALLMGWFIYAGMTGWKIFSNEGNQQNWKSSGPGYHK